MWLPKDERKLLQRYYVTIGEVGKRHEFPLETLIGFIKSSTLPKLTHPDSQQYVNKDETWHKEWSRVITANKALEERGLIIGSHDNDIFIRTTKEAGPNPRLTFSLTITGYDLGRKYNSWWSQSGLWFAEYKDHWFWLIVGFLGGIIGGLFINWLS